MCGYLTVSGVSLQCTQSLVPLPTWPDANQLCPFISPSVYVLLFVMLIRAPLQVQRADTPWSSTRVTGLHAIARWRAPHEPAHQPVGPNSHTLASAVFAEQDSEVPPMLVDAEARPECHAHSRADVVSVGAGWIGEGAPVPPQSLWIPDVPRSCRHWTACRHESEDGLPRLAGGGICVPLWVVHPWQRKLPVRFHLGKLDGQADSLC
jgi:hypothetical protein